MLWARLAVVAGGVVVGFPILTSLALTTAPASHGAVVIALLPAATAVMAVIRGRERPPRVFWIWTALGAVAAIAFGFLQSGGFGALHWADVPPSGSPVQWAAFAYLGVVSMFLGFFAWYHGLAIGPMTRVSQVQLAQPVLTLLWAGLLLGETLTWTTIGGGLVIILCAGAAVRVRTTSGPMNLR